MEEHRFFKWRRRNLEQRVVVDKGNVDPAGIAGVGMNYRITPRAVSAAFSA